MRHLYMYFCAAPGGFRLHKPNAAPVHVLLCCPWWVLSTKALCCTCTCAFVLPLVGAVYKSCCTCTCAFVLPLVGAVYISLCFTCTCASVLLLLDVSVYNGLSGTTGHAEYREIYAKFTTPRVGAFILFSIQKRSKLGILLQIDANEIEIRKNNIFLRFF
jgi:hypothetical protein